MLHVFHACGAVVGVVLHHVLYTCGVVVMVAHHGFFIDIIFGFCFPRHDSQDQVLYMEVERVLGCNVIPYFTLEDSIVQVATLESNKPSKVKFTRNTKTNYEPKHTHTRPMVDRYGKWHVKNQSEIKML